MITAKRIFPDNPRVFPGNPDGLPYKLRHQWPARWIQCPSSKGDEGVYLYRLSFSIDRADKVIFHVSGDNRYLLFLDGHEVGRGSERGALTQWFYESYEVELSPGDHYFYGLTWLALPVIVWKKVKNQASLNEIG